MITVNQSRMEKIDLLDIINNCKIIFIANCKGNVSLIVRCSIEVSAIMVKHLRNNLNTRMLWNWLDSIIMSNYPCYNYNKSDRYLITINNPRF